MAKEDWHLLGIHWHDKYFVDKCLPFGLRSAPLDYDRPLWTTIGPFGLRSAPIGPFGLRLAPYLFNMVAEWILRHYFNISDLIHYLDDFFFAAPASSPGCLNALLDMLLLCRAVGAPVKPEKVLGPSTTLTILGIKLDTDLRQACLPQEKLTALLEELSQFLSLSPQVH